MTRLAGECTIGCEATNGSAALAMRSGWLLASFREATRLRLFDLNRKFNWFWSLTIWFCSVATVWCSCLIWSSLFASSWFFDLMMARYFCSTLTISCLASPLYGLKVAPKNAFAELGVKEWASGAGWLALRWGCIGRAYVELKCFLCFLLLPRSRCSAIARLNWSLLAS